MSNQKQNSQQSQNSLGPHCAVAHHPALDTRTQRGQDSNNLWDNVCCAPQAQMSLATQIWGYCGGFFLFLNLIPQVYTTFKTKNTAGMSSIWLFFQFLASFCFMIYGYLLGGVGLPVVLSNSSALFCTCALIIAKITFQGTTTLSKGQDTQHYGAIEE